MIENDLVSKFGKWIWERGFGFEIGKVCEKKKFGRLRLDFGQKGVKGVFGFVFFGDMISYELENECSLFYNFI